MLYFSNPLIPSVVGANFCYIQFYDRSSLGGNGTYANRAAADRYRMEVLPYDGSTDIGTLDEPCWMICSGTGRCTGYYIEIMTGNSKIRCTLVRFAIHS